MDTTLVLLGLLGSGAEYGYDLKQSYDRWLSPSRPLPFGQVYTTLARLIRDGLIEAVGIEPGDGPERKRYAITPAGRDRVLSWMYTPDSRGAALQSNLFAKTVIALMLGEDADRLLDLQRTQLLEQMRELTRQKRGADLQTVLLADHAIVHIEADLQWIDLTADRLSDLRDKVTK